MEILSNPSWKKQGTVIREKISTSEAIKKAGLDWSVVKQPLNRINEQGEPVLIKDSVALVREDIDEFFGVASKNISHTSKRKNFQFSRSIY
ncbi:MAG: hypothetical protein F6K40_12405 [Okeania sp. SIO3I5]|uniref:hypothetical protein n=1 Tax=Okeania sp. SIO3I5 TaxID=2607805 RepID=UPI0013B5FDC3|nr:hypothetical protein [Okeania sp. SIO3I5]NEQ37031.1 hypothetical protein [Okeania sp. SIO3I5]